MFRKIKRPPPPPVPIDDTSAITPEPVPSPVSQGTMLRWEGHTAKLAVTAYLARSVSHSEKCGHSVTKHFQGSFQRSKDRMERRLAQCKGQACNASQLCCLPTNPVSSLKRQHPQE